MAEVISVNKSEVAAVNASLKKIASELNNPKDLNNSLGKELTAKASARVPRLTGALAASIGSTVKGNTLQIYAGSQSVPYAGVIEYGWPQKGREERPYLRPAVYDNISLVIKSYDDYAGKLIRQYNR